MAKTKIFSLLFLTSMLLLAALSLENINTQAQSKATVYILSTVGGTTDPKAGNYTYDDGTSLTITAAPSQAPGFIFANWVISTEAGTRLAYDNPLTFPVTGGTTYTIQAVFQVIQPIGITDLPKDMSNLAIVVILPAAGGTTTPSPGTYAFDNASSLNLTATPDSGWAFSHWVISGNITSHGAAPLNLEPTDNPYNVNHGYGATFYYQPVFTQTNEPTPSPSIPEVSAVALAGLVLALIPVVLFARKRKTIAAD